MYSPCLRWTKQRGGGGEEAGQPEVERLQQRTIAILEIILEVKVKILQK